MYRTCNSYSEQSRCVAELADACSALMRKLRYSAPDARTVALDNLIAVTRSGQMILNLLDSWTRGDETVRRVIPQLIGLTKVTTEGVRAAGDILNKSSRLGFVVLGQFQIENALRNIAHELIDPNQPTGFYRIAASVISALGLPIDRLEILNTPARIRNSLHSNGIHHRQHPSEAAQVTIGGVLYEFKDGQPVTCAGWEHIAHALQASVGVFEEICLSAPIRAMADPLMDHYAWEQETKPKNG
jgi:hypothetical protein